MFDTINEIKKSERTKRLYTQFIFAVPISNLVAPYIVAFCAWKRIKPNSLTLFMFPFAIISSVFICMDNVVILIIGALLMHIWFGIDIADGQLARYTKTYAPYGTELDYMMHQICHLFFIIAFFFFFYRLGEASLTFTLIIAVAMTYVEYSFRNLCSIGSLIVSKSKEPNSNTVVGSKWRTPFALVRLIVGGIINNFCSIDNYVTIGSFVLVIDYLAHCHILLYVTYMFVIATLVKCIRWSVTYLKIVSKY